ncbi:hypothetical protein DSO57_1030591 [Entomophthora muscae]|uniref:Uncharacterized protein n=1 Tax=Entomophthora muscae TaxID=34485 RepID=A0ACC2SDU5_9FUNG|nr:hypothetical protein DSO57_1030591 [Entomophthora muscae]
MFSESYGGHYLPNIAKLIMQQRQIQLKSIVIGNGLINPHIQFRAYFKMACDGETKLFDSQECQRIKYRLNSAYVTLDSCHASQNPKVCMEAWKKVDDAIVAPYVNNGKDIYNINQNLPNYYDSSVNRTETFFNQPHVQKALAIAPTTFKAESEGVYNSFFNSGDLMDSLMDPISQLLDDQVRVLLFAGDADFLCNWIGLETVTEQFNWYGSSKFRSQSFHYWFDPQRNQVAWRLRSFRNLSFVRLLNTTHMVSIQLV